METFSALVALFVGTGEFPSQRPVTRSIDVSFDLRLNRGLSTQSRRWWFETPSHSVWRHCNVLVLSVGYLITHLSTSGPVQIWSVCCTRYKLWGKSVSRLEPLFLLIRHGHCMINQEDYTCHVSASGGTGQQNYNLQTRRGQGIQCPGVAHGTITENNASF